MIKSWAGKVRGCLSTQWLAEGDCLVWLSYMQWLAVLSSGVRIILGIYLMSYSFMVDLWRKVWFWIQIKKKELSEEQYDAYQLGWTDGDDILFLTKKTNKKKQRWYSARVQTRTRKKVDMGCFSSISLHQGAKKPIYFIWQLSGL